MTKLYNIFRLNTTIYQYSDIHIYIYTLNFLELQACNGAALPLTLYIYIYIYIYIYMYVCVCVCVCGPGSSVGTATDHGLEDSGWNPGGDEIFRPSSPAWGPPSLLYNGYRVFPGGKVRWGRAADHSTHPLGHTVPVTGSLYLYIYIPTERPPPVGEVSANFCG